MEILNHLVDLSEFGIEYTEEDKRILVQFQDELINTGYEIKYINAPVVMTEDGLMTALSKQFSKASSGNELFKQLNEDFATQTKYKQVFDNRIYIYKMAKLKFMDAETLYAIRIGTDYKFN